MRTLPALILLAIAAPAFAGPDDFTTGPVIEDFGPAAAVPGAAPIPGDVRFRVAFDAVDDADELNRTLVSAARFLNMNGKAGVGPERIDLAVVIHGGAVMDVLDKEAHAARKDGADNPNAPLVAALRERGVRVIVCGQTAAYRGVAADDLLPGVEMDLSAMTAHARLQQDGFTLNPF
jgi:intracellular sulfur oxidation DsrE/DsrF family protein